MRELDFVENLVEGLEERRGNEEVFYCATIAYHLGLNAVSGGHRQSCILKKNESIMTKLHMFGGSPCCR